MRNIDKTVRASRLRRGFALIMVLIAVAVGVVLGLSYVSSASIKLEGSRNHLYATRAKYLAESGLQHALYVLWENPSALEGTSAAHSLGAFQADGSRDSYEFWAVQDPCEAGLYTVTARAAIGGVTQTAALKVFRSPPYSNLMMANGPTGYWPLGEESGTQAGDIAGHDYDLACDNGVTMGAQGAIPADHDTALSFDGVNDYMYRPPTPELQVKGDLTLTLWFKLDQLPVGTNRMILLTCSEQGAAPSDNASYELAINSGGSVEYLQEYGSGQQQVHVFDTLHLAPNTWHNLVVTRTISGPTIAVYLAGHLVASWTYGAPGPPKPNAGKSAGIYIGSAWGQGSFLDGSMDELAVFNKALSAAQIQALHDAAMVVEKMEIRSWER
jgi:hypothetical protein